MTAIIIVLIIILCVVGILVIWYWIKQYKLWPEKNRK